MSKKRRNITVNNLTYQWMVAEKSYKLFIWEPSPSTKRHQFYHQSEETTPRKIEEIIKEKILGIPLQNNIAKESPKLITLNKVLDPDKKPVICMASQPEAYLLVCSIEYEDDFGVDRWSNTVDSIHTDPNIAYEAAEKANNYYNKLEILKAKYRDFLVSNPDNHNSDRKQKFFKRNDMSNEMVQEIIKNNGKIRYEVQAKPLFSSIEKKSESTVQIRGF